MLGLVLCYVYEKKGLFASIIIHAEFNAFAVISILFYQS
jgi:membrane protease YdiL (CAAX protease family)